jgi:tetratricopeptide (TPR) repeat protein
MPDALPLRIFLASPYDLVDERAVVLSSVEEHRLARSETTNVTFEVVGGRRVRGTARRPQEAIDELIAESHLLVAIFKKSWGSEPGSPWGFSSGTEEELFTGLLELGRSDQPMRDVWVAFVDDPDPDPRISALRQQMEDRNSMLYESVTDLIDLRMKLDGRLEGWESSAAVKVPRYVDLLPSSGVDVLQAARLRLNGEKLVELGQPAVGQAMLKSAAEIGGPAEHLAYSRVLARQGDLASALSSAETAVGFFTGDQALLYSPQAAEAFAAQAGILRRLGRHVEASDRLEHALTLVPGQTIDSVKVRGRILDELGLAYQKAGDRELARARFTDGLALRQAHGAAPETAQSLVNLARLEVSEGDLDAASRLAEEAEALLRGTPPTALHANSELLLAQCRLRQHRSIEGLPHASRALSLNRQFSNRTGEARSLLLLAQCNRAAGRLADASRCATELLEVSRANSNLEGESRAEWLLLQLAAPEG